MAIEPGKPNKIYRGSVENNSPQIKELPCVAAGFLPGMVVVEAAGEFALPAAAAEGFIYVLNSPLHQSPLTYVYGENEVAYGYIPSSGQHYLARLDAGTYWGNTPLATNGTGGLRLAAEGEKVVAYTWNPYGAPQTVPAGGDLADVRIR